VTDAFRLDGKVALVTGGSEGIGRAIAEVFVAAGATVCLVARRRELLDDTVRALQGMQAGGGRVIGVVGSVTDAAVREESVRRAVDELSGLDILVNNAALSAGRALLVDLPASDMDEVVLVNQKVPVLYAQLAWHAAMSTRGGVIVNISSHGSLRPRPGFGWYAATKAALNALTRQMALELAPGVRVNGIAPGTIVTEALLRGTDEAHRAAAARRPLARLGTPADVAHAALYLASDASSFMTGQVLALEGGGLLQS
jgi:NAD(P)-dependent dehydrogenase (short-subunit alcohol dehydrogenase family)